MEIHFTDLAALYPQTKKDALEATVTPLNDACARFDISTGARAAAFVSQLGHESMGFVAMAENLNYSADGLHSTFPRYFPTADLRNAYAHQPQKIANRVYASRMGNGNEASGDGWNYRGRGFLQLTGKENYQSFASYMEFSLADTVAYLETREGAAMASGWFWAMRKLNQYADQGKFRELTIRINGGTNGLADRLAHFEKAKRLFG